MENTKLLPLGTEQGLEETEYPSFDLCLGENMVSPLVAQHRQWLKTIRHEVPNPKIPFKVAVYIRFFNQTKYRDEEYLERNKEVFRATLAQYPMWEFVGFYIDNPPNINGFNQYKRRNKGERGDTFRRTAQKFSAQYNVSTGSVQKYAIFSKALDVVGQAAPELPGKVLSGTFKISHENLVALSKMPPEEIRRIGARPEDLQHPFTSYSDTRKEFADTDEEPVESMQETLPLIKIPPMHDPDAEIAGLTLTVPSWVSSIERARNNADMNAASTSAKSKLEEALLSLQKKVSEMLSEIREVD